MLYTIFLLLVAFLGIINAIMHWPLSPQDKNFAFYLAMKLVSIFVVIISILLLLGVIISK